MSTDRSARFSWRRLAVLATVLALVPIGVGGVNGAEAPLVSMFAEVCHVELKEFDGLRLLGPFAKSAAVQCENPRFTTALAESGYAPDGVRTAFPLKRGGTTERIEVRLIPVQRPPFGSRWIGRVGADSSGFASLVVKSGDPVVRESDVIRPTVFTMDAWLADGTQVQIRPTSAEGVYVVRQLDPSLLPPHLDPLPQTALAKPNPCAPKSSPVAEAELKVLALYTAQALSEFNSKSALRFEVDQAVLNFDSVLQFSGLSTTAQPRYATLAACLPCGVDESGSYREILGRLASDTSVARLRDAHAADVVFLVVANASARGLSRRMQVVDAAFEADAFVVVQAKAAAADLTLAHEFGHVLGCCHEIDDKCKLPMISSAGFGYHFDHPILKVHVGTVMSRVGNRMPLFSSPSLSYFGVLVGSAAADNASVVRSTFDTVGGFRP